MTADESIAALVAESAGLDRETMGADLARALAARASACGVSGLDRYLERLRGSSAELESLIERLVVPETWFFRDRGPFEFLERYAREQRRLRVLSAPCSTGEEAYSIAITLIEAGLPPSRFHIDACDISRQALETAARAIYGRSSFRESWRDYRSRYFQPLGDRLALVEEVARLPEFRRENLLRPSFLAGKAAYDVIFCRNLLIYLGREARRAVIENIGRMLLPGGVLIAGHAELAPLLQHGYTAVPYPRSFACRKAEKPAAAARPAPRPAVPMPAAVPVAEDTPQLLELARQSADRGSLKHAWALCDLLLARHEAEAEAYYLKGLISGASDSVDAAEEHLRKALYLDPNHYEALIEMSVLCERKGETARGDLFRARARRVAESRIGAQHAGRS